MLAAARCNMFSHALVAYQSALMEFFVKTTETFNTTIGALEKEPHYSFTILKELTQNEGILPVQSNENISSCAEGGSAVDTDQLLFFNVSSFICVFIYLTWKYISFL